MPESPYSQADKTIRALNRQAIKRFEDCKQACFIKGFDELNAISLIKKLYKNVDADNRRALQLLYRRKYLDVFGGGVKDDTVDELAALAIMGILSTPNPITRYTYDTEVFRKRDRAAEAVNAATGNANKQEEMNKALQLWSQMTGQYVDYTSDKANIQALKDSGAKHVVWHTQNDGKVCSECEKRDKRIYPISAIPEKPHWRCRCYVTN